MKQQVYKAIAWYAIAKGTCCAVGTAIKTMRAPQRIEEYGRKFARAYYSPFTEEAMRSGATDRKA